MKKIPNPFTLPFEYNNHRYNIKDETTQAMLFLWFYGINHSSAVKNLFIFYGEGCIYYSNHWVKLHKRLQKVEKYGVREPNYLGRCLLKLVEDCHKSFIPIENVEQFYTFVKFWTLKQFPALEATLHTIFERINLFF